MKAPDKIYADSEVFNISDEFNDLLQTKEEGCVEYTRTDALIEKACKYISLHQCEYINFEDFKDYMKGE